MSKSYFPGKIVLLCLILLTSFFSTFSQVYYPGGMSSTSLSTWFDASDASTITLHYNTTSVTGTGTSGSSTITSSASLAASLPVGAQLRQVIYTGSVTHGTSSESKTIILNKGLQKECTY